MKLDSIANIISQAIQDGDISPIEFHKVLQEVEKYRKLKADIRNQAKAKVRQITKERWEELLEQGRKEDKEDSFRKIANTSGILGVSAIWTMKFLHLTECDFMVYKAIKSTLKIYFANMWNQLQDPAPHLFSFLPLSHHPLTSTFDHTLFYQWLADFDIIQARHTNGSIWAKNNLFVPCDGVADGFVKLFLCFHTVSTEYIQLFCKF